MANVTTKSTLSIEGLTQDQYDLIVRLVGAVIFNCWTGDLFADLVGEVENTWDLEDDQGKKVLPIYPVNKREFVW